MAKSDGELRLDIFFDSLRANVGKYFSEHPELKAACGERVLEFMDDETPSAMLAKGGMEFLIRMVPAMHEVERALTTDEGLELVGLTMLFAAFRLECREQKGGPDPAPMFARVLPFKNGGNDVES